MDVNVGGYCSCSVRVAATFLVDFGEHLSVMICPALLVSKRLHTLCLYTLHFRTGQGPCHANLHKWGLAQSPSCDCGQQPHEPHCPHVPIKKSWRQTESMPRSRWWRSCVAGIYSDCSTRKMLIIIQWQCLYYGVLMRSKCCRLIGVERVSHDFRHLYLSYNVTWSEVILSNIS